MSISVIADVVHPRARASINRVPNTPYITAEQVRVFKVEGLDDGAVGMSATALVRGLTNFGIPTQGTLAPGVLGNTYGASAIDYDTEVIPQSDNSIYVIVRYATPIPRAVGGGPALFVINDKTTQMQTTRSTHPKDLTPLLIGYKDPTDAHNVIPDRPAEVSYSQSLRRVSVAGYIARQDLTNIRSILNSVNDTDWMGYPKGYWQFKDLETEQTFLGDTTKISAEYVSQVDIPWMHYELLRSEFLGQLITVAPVDSAYFLNKGYFYGQEKRNGITGIGFWKTQPFADIFGFDEVDGQPTQLTRS